MFWWLLNLVWKKFGSFLQHNLALPYVNLNYPNRYMILFYHWRRIRMGIICLLWHDHCRSKKIGKLCFVQNVRLKRMWLRPQSQNAFSASPEADAKVRLIMMEFWLFYVILSSFLISVSFQESLASFSTVEAMVQPVVPENSSVPDFSKLDLDSLWSTGTRKLEVLLQLQLPNKPCFEWKNGETKGFLLNKAINPSISWWKICVCLPKNRCCLYHFWKLV